MEKSKNEKLKHNKIIVIVVIISLILDQMTKIIAYKNNFILNQDISNQNNGYYIVMTIIIVLMILRYISNDNTYIKLDTKIILSLAMSGAIGNLIDRIWFKKVIVFINLEKGLILNLSYLYILIAWVGMAIILTKNTMKFLKDKKGDKNGYKENKSK